VNKKDINIPEFNHATGSIELMSRAVKYAPVVILEGVTAFSDSIKDLTHLRVFLEGKDPWVTKALRFLVCLEQRNRSINKSRWSAEKEYSSYSNFLAEKKKSANIVVKVEKNWSMQIDTDWDGTFSL